jgi:hypothetical protein
VSPAEGNGRSPDEPPRGRTPGEDPRAPSSPGEPRSGGAGGGNAPRDTSPSGGWRVRTVLVALDASRSSRAVAAAAAELAAALSAELAGLFVEDAALARAATLPGDWEVGSYAARPTAGASLASRLRAQAERARRQFEAGAGRAAVAGRFQVVRGTVQREVVAAGGETVLLSLGRVGASGVSRLGSVARAALAEGRGPLLLLPPGGRLGPPVVAVYGGGVAGRHALEAASRLMALRSAAERRPRRRGSAQAAESPLGRRRSTLVVLLPAAGPADADRLHEEAAAVAADLGVEARYRPVRLEGGPPGSPDGSCHPADRHALAHAVAAEGANALVVPLASPLATTEDVETVVRALDCAVLLVRGGGVIDPFPLLTRRP